MESRPTNELNNILLRISKGDEKAFALFFDCFYPKVYAFCLPLLRKEYLAEEVVQEVMLKIWNMRYDLPSVQHIDGFMMVVARNRCIDLMRANIKRERHQEVYLNRPDSCHFTDERAILTQAKTLLRECLELLPSRQREIYDLAEHQNKSLDQIAEMLQIKKETVKAHLKLAKKALRSYLLDRLDLTILLIILKLF